MTASHPIAAATEIARQLPLDVRNTCSNNERRHSGICMLTPATVHYGQAKEVLQKRHEVLLDAYRAHPERFPRPPRQQQLPEKA
jgi:hypothetical protein